MFFRGIATGVWAGAYKQSEGRLTDMEFAIIVVAVIALIGFKLWLQHRRRLLIHRERLTAIEKGIELPQVDQDVRRNNARIQRFLLLAGLIWISLGFGVFVFFTAVLAHPQQEQIPQGIQWSGVAPVLIGVSHLIVYFANRNKEI
jgi:hypothetical protein